MCGGLLQALIALLLCYSVIAIRYMIGKQGLANKVNYTMFLVNGAGAVLYAFSAAIWYWFFYKYAMVYYDADSTPEQKT